MVYWSGPKRFSNSISIYCRSFNYTKVDYDVYARGKGGHIVGKFECNRILHGNFASTRVNSRVIDVSKIGQVRAVND